MGVRARQGREVGVSVGVMLKGNINQDRESDVKGSVERKEG